jgi:radical SAM protein with 4Fe4S-binding SPASM domain
LSGCLLFRTEFDVFFEVREYIELVKESLAMLEKWQRLKASAKNFIRYNRCLRPLVTLMMVDYQFPSVLGIDPTNICNLKCKICPASFDKSPRGMMARELFKRIINESLKYGKRWMIILHNFGEPLIHPQIAEMVRIIKEKKAAEIVQFATNGILATEEILNDLISAGLDAITFSIDAYSPEEYKELKGLDALEKVKANVRLLMDLKKKRQSVLPWVCAKMIRRRGFEHTFKPFLDEWRKIADEVALTPFSNWAGDITYQGTEPIRKKRYACHFLWYYPVINWQGDVFICCATFSPQAIIGNLEKESIHDIWTREKLRKIREAHLKKDFRQIPYCADCTYWSESNFNLDYFLRA